MPSPGIGNYPVFPGSAGAAGHSLRTMGHEIIIPIYTGTPRFKLSFSGGIIAVCMSVLSVLHELEINNLRVFSD